MLVKTKNNMQKSEYKDCDEKDSKSTSNWAIIQFDELEIGERIGGGGVGIIYKGYWRNKSVALKTLFDPRISEELKKEYMDELLIMSKVKHSNIVEFLGASIESPNLCFVMELCECSLHHLLHVERPNLSDYTMIQMAIDIASAMEYLHSLRPAIIHRDLKALNVLKAFDGSLKLCDFGLVMVKHSQAGTPSYMAPELFQNKPFTKSIDTYSFGVLLWELFTHEIPFYQVQVADIRDRVLSGDRPPLTSFKYPNGCKKLIESCWHQNQENRPSFTEIVDTLYEISNSIPSSKNLDIIDGVDALDMALSKK